MKFYKSAIFALIILNLFTCYSLYTNKVKLTSVTEKYWDYDFRINHIMDNREKLITFSKLQYHAENQEVKNIALYDKDNKKVFISDILSNHSKLIYYYSETGCSSCFEPFLYKLDSITNLIGKDNIIVISDYANYRTFKASVNDKFKHINIYRITQKLDMIKTHDNDYAYAFLMKSDRKAHKVIITDKINTDFTDEYISYMTEYFKQMDMMIKSRP